MSKAKELTREEMIEFVDEKVAVYFKKTGKPLEWDNISKKRFITYGDSGGIVVYILSLEPGIITCQKKYKGIEAGIMVLGIDDLTDKAVKRIYNAIKKFIDDDRTINVYVDQPKSCDKVDITIKV